MDRRRRRDGTGGSGCVHLLVTRINWIVMTNKARRSQFFSIGAMATLLNLADIERENAAIEQKAGT